ncbi:MAG: type II toxin-antitoxin system HicB family antitoxin [FCB group bacterium]|nr:type II toxin-antitoxin system HicB family antitoxin [FCB group bacterium]
MKTFNKAISVIIEKTDTGFSAFCSDHPVYTTGGSIPELMDNAVEALCLYFEDQNRKIAHENIKFEIDFQQFFQYYKVINARLLAGRIGMNPTLISQYVRGHKKPSAKQAEKIISGLHHIGRELAEIELIYK